MRFARECISKARRALDEAGYPNIEIIAKLNGSDILPGGVTPEILAASAKELEKVGVAMITVNAGGGLTRLEGMSGDGHRAEGWKLSLIHILCARLKVSSTFSKVVESRGKASGRAPQSAEPPCAHKRSGRGFKGETLSRGFPLFIFTLLRVRRFPRQKLPPPTASSTPFLCSCAKKRGGAPKKNAYGVVAPP